MQLIRMGLALLSLLGSSAICAQGAAWPAKLKSFLRGRRGCHDRGSNVRSCRRALAQASRA